MMSDQLLAELLRVADQAATRGLQPPFAIGLSGGADSVALLLACHQARLPVVAFHVNHQLQAPANEWESFCGDLCTSLGVPFTSRRIQVERAGGESLEAVARQYRYEALQDMMVQQGLQVLLTAHHADDQLETVLLQLFRGSGLGGLAGMATWAPWPTGTSDLSLCRPWLNQPKAALLAFLREHQQAFIEDPSNTDTRYRRNYLRQTVIPGLREAFPQLDASVEKLSRQVSHLRQEWREEAELFFNQHCDELGRLNGKAWRLLEPQQRQRILHQWLKNNGVRLDERKTLELDEQLMRERGGVRRVASTVAVGVKQGWFEVLH